MFSMLNHFNSVAVILILPTSRTTPVDMTAPLCAREDEVYLNLCRSGLRLHHDLDSPNATLAVRRGYRGWPIRLSTSA